MTDNSGKASGRILLYSSPQVKVILVKPQGVLCSSGNDPLGEKDYGDGGFHKV